MDSLIKGLAVKAGKKITQDNVNDFNSYKQSQYDLLADLVEESLDIKELFNIIGISENKI